MSELLDVPIDAIDSNPFRQLATYPFVERKLVNLTRSIAQVGLWEGIIGRRIAGRYEIAFGHHRVEAGKRSGLATIPIIVRDLNDEQMLQFMGRENMEDYNADFLCMLETWEAGLVFSPSIDGKLAQPLDIARLLGWTVAHSKDGHELLNNTARACNAAYTLISGGYLAREDLQDMTVANAREIVERAQARVEQLERIAKEGKQERRDIEHAKRQIGKGAKETARQSREGRVAHKDLRGQVDVNTYRFARKSKRKTPLFSMFGKNLADSIGKMLHNDSAAEKLEEICKALDDVSLDEDKRIIARLDFELSELSERTKIWQKRIIPTEKKVTHLQVTREE